MHSHQIEQLARQRTEELRRIAGPGRAHVGQRGPGNTIRNRAGWTLVAIGLRIAGSRGQ
ncbi:MAG TPA: hypothetical protein VN840_14750 [Streptosporangiaceae bacterium]|nr:hypothetical protein [Streptosporangiaceae bacterium]